MPILCNYYLTERCNAYCGFCAFGDHARYAGTRHAVTADVLRNLPALKKLGVRFVDFTGGEPLLHPDLPEILRAAHALGLRTSVTTNGLLYPKRAEELRGGVDLLHFSLDAARAELHDAMRGVPCFDAVMESIALARALGEFPDIIFTVTGENAGEMEGVYELCVRWGLVLLLNPLFAHDSPQSLSTATLDAIEAFAARPMVYLNPSFLTLRRAGGNDPARPLCRAVSRVVVISPRNELLLPCYHFHTERIPIGGDLLRVHASGMVREHRRMEGRHAFCRGCTINCYFEPSFAFPTSRLGLAAAPSKVKYGFAKYIRQPLLRRREAGE